MNKSICIFGAGGFAQEMIFLATELGYKVDACLDINNIGSTVYNIPVRNEDYFDINKHLAVVAIASPKIRKPITERLVASGAEFVMLVHPSAIISPGVIIGRGSIVCAFCFISNGVILGKWTQLNWATTIGHEATLGDFITTAPGVHISGTVHMGDSVYMGTNSAIIDKLSITSNVVIGAGAVVVRDITESGTYIGVPAKKLIKGI
ncbi:MAG: NeuD/PglB/VioB family sugar acetyltransferase [Bacteroidales bacterium]|jgi:sugar O-acyltransferase (sialic acid O-acetyltransferase NeuD family)